MRFAHIADVHIGSWRDPKLKDLSTVAFMKAIDSALSENVSFILIAGDLFNTALPGIDQIKAVMRKLKEVKNARIPVYFIAGSHDFSPSGKTMLDIIEEAELGVNVTRGEITPDGKLRLLFTTDENTGAKITGMIGKRGMLEKNYYDSLDKTNLESADGFKVFMFHTALDELKPEEMSEMPSSPASFLPKGFDYYAGGHVHIVKQRDLSEHGYKLLVYPGPVFPANFSELEKLGVGGYYVYDDGELERKEIVVKESIGFNIDVDGRSSEQATAMIREEIEGKDVTDKIVLIRVSGKLSSGNPNNVDFKTIIDNLYSAGAYYVMKNTTKLSSREFEAVQVTTSSAEELEEKLIREHLGKIANNFLHEFEMTKSRMRTFSLEKHEGEKQNEYEARVRKEIDLLMEKERK